MNGNGDDFFTLSNFELFRLRFLAAGGFFPIDPFARRFGERLVPQLRPSGGIPGLVPAPTSTAPSILASVPTRGAPLSNEGELPVAPPTITGISLPRLLPASAPGGTLPTPGFRIPAGVTPTPEFLIRRGALQQGINNINATSGGEMALDLGNLIATLGTEFIRSRFGGPSVVPTGGGFGGGFLPTQPAFNLFDPFGLTETAPTTGVGGACPPADDTRLGKLQSCRVDPCTGAVTLVRRTRRRRRALATARDIKDLAALMGVANVKSSQPQLVTTWIATRGR